MYQSLISVAELADKLDRSEWRVIDCRFVLAAASAAQEAAQIAEEGRRQWCESHLPGALYAHLDQDLSGPILPGKTGRHPLPDRLGLALRCAEWGIGPTTQVVAYDDSGGAFASRFWWLLRWLGHRPVAVLDGGWSAWCAAGLPVDDRETEAVPRGEFSLGQPLLQSVDAQALLDASGAPTAALLDARDPARFAGEVEPLDPVAGHIPGAVCVPFAGNLRDGRFLPKDELRARFESLLDPRGAAQTICYCGSGVTAAHNVLAMQHAGFDAPKLYAGSWSEWITDPARPVALGAD